jgi:hypothetical protein
MVGPGEAYTSINQAIAAAGLGDTVYIRGGSHNEKIQVDQGGRSDDERLVIRKNIMHGFAENAVDLKGAAHVLVEGNVIQGAEGDNDGRLFGADPDRNAGGAITHGSNAVADHRIVRRNVVYDNSGGIGFSWPTSNTALHNNTVIANNRDYSGPQSIFVWTSINVPSGNCQFNLQLE